MGSGKPGPGGHEPVLMAIEYADSKVFHTPLGHADYSMKCAGFITAFQRGAEWAASGEVTQEVPDDFPVQEEVKRRPWGD